MQIATLSIVTLTIIGLISSIIFFPKLKIGKFSCSTFWMVTLLGAVILISIQAVKTEDIVNTFLSDTSMNPLKILVLFISMTCLSIYLDQLGFFSFVANWFASRFNQNQYRLFFGLYLLISVLTIFTSNDIIILTFTPFIIYFSKRNQIDPLPYLIMEFVAANTWSMVFIIGNPTNIYLASVFSLDFFSYFIHMIIPTLVSSVVSLGLLFLIFHRKLKESVKLTEGERITLRKVPVTIGLILLLSATIMLAISSYIGLEMWYIAASAALCLILFVSVYSLIRKENRIGPLLKAMPWNLIPFVLSMFVLVLSLTNTGITDQIIALLSGWNETFTYGLSGTLMANLMNNIPMAVLYGTLLDGANVKAVYASVLASNIAAYITPIGALAGIMWMNLLKSHDIRMSFPQFMKYGVSVGIPTILMALLSLEYFVRF